MKSRITHLTRRNRLSVRLKVHMSRADGAKVSAGRNGDPAPLTLKISVYSKSSAICRVISRVGVKSMLDFERSELGLGLGLGVSSLGRGLWAFQPTTGC